MSQKHRILNYLNAGGRLTPLTALRFGMGMRLGARIYDLRREGYPIQQRMVKVRNADGTEAEVAEYWLELRPVPPPAPVMAGSHEQGRMF